MVLAMQSAVVSRVSRPARVEGGDVMISIPDGTASMSIRDAAVAYANAGWFICPVRRDMPKHAGSALGKGWPDKTSRDADQVARWFSTSEAEQRGGIALHTGRSGAIVFDLDSPGMVPETLRRVLLDLSPALQVSRRAPEEHGGLVRGHYAFALPDGVTLGSGRGALATEPTWGDVRSGNSIIVAAPTPHVKPEGFYRWTRTGTLPELPAEIGRLLLARPASGLPSDLPPASSVNLRARVRGVLRFLADAPEGERNRRLFWASCRFGEWAAYGHVDEDEARDMLTAIAERVGLDERETTDTITSGLRTGAWAR